MNPTPPPETPIPAEAGTDPTRPVVSSDVSAGARIGPATRVWGLAQVREGARIGAECVIGRGVYVGAGVVIGDRCKVQNDALLYEPAVLGDGVFVGPAVVLTNDRAPRAVTSDGELKGPSDWTPVGVRVGDGASLGARSVCVAPVSIGRWAMVAAGAVVTHDVPDHALVAGVPARRIGWVGRAGVRLVPDGGYLVCPVTGTRHRVENDALREER